MLTRLQLIDPKRKEAIKQAKKTKARLEKLNVVIKRGFGTDGRLVHPVTAQSVADYLLKKHGERIPVKQIQYKDSATAGRFTAVVHLVEDVYANISVNVESR